MPALAYLKNLTYSNHWVKLSWLAPKFNYKVFSAVLLFHVEINRLFLSDNPVNDCTVIA